DAACHIGVSGVRGPCRDSSAQYENPRAILCRGCEEVQSAHSCQRNQPACVGADAVVHAASEASVCPRPESCYARRNKEFALLVPGNPSQHGNTAGDKTCEPPTPRGGW